MFLSMLENPSLVSEGSPSGMPSTFGRSKMFSALRYSSSYWSPSDLLSTDRVSVSSSSKLTMKLVIMLAQAQAALYVSSFAGLGVSKMRLEKDFGRVSLSALYLLSTIATYCVDSVCRTFVSNLF